MSKIKPWLWSTGLAVCLSAPVQALEWQGKAGVDALLFSDQGLHAEQNDQYYSALFELEAFAEVSENAELKSKFFHRQSTGSASRTHTDVRELMLYSYGEDWELHLGVGKTFWGTTETRHLVDVINQIDWVESLDDEARLGQPMVAAKLIRDWGTVDFFILPYFREIQFLSEDARPRLNPVVDVDNPIYQADEAQRHIDYALRWSQSYEAVDIGVSYFKGTQRQPLFTPQTFNGQLVGLTPVYVQTQQVGVDLQYIYGDWLWKFEGLMRDSHQADFTDYQSSAAVLGTEFTWVGVLDSDHDLGLITEYQYDEWEATTPFQNDWVVGVRWVLNDVQSTELLLTHSYDLDYDTRVWLLNASRRIGDNWKAEVVARWLGQLGKKDPAMAAFKKDDLIHAQLHYYF